LLNFKNKQSVRLTKFRAKAQQWAKTTVASRNQSKVLDNLALMVSKVQHSNYTKLKHLFRRLYNIYFFTY